MKVRAFIVSPEAKQDLIALYDWIADRSSNIQALAYLERIETHLAGFSHASERGHLREDIRPGLRITGFEKRITIAFTVSDHSVNILRLLYGGQDWEEGLEQ